MSKDITDINLKKSIETILRTDVDPVLAEHYGGAELTAIDDDGKIYVKLTGACASCPSAQMTIEDVVKDIIMKKCPYVKDVVLDTSVAQDLIDMARSILSRKDKV